MGLMEGEWKDWRFVKLGIEGVKRKSGALIAPHFVVETLNRW